MPRWRNLLRTGTWTESLSITHVEAWLRAHVHLAQVKVEDNNGKGRRKRLTLWHFFVSVGTVTKTTCSTSVAKSVHKLSCHPACSTEKKLQPQWCAQAFSPFSSWHEVRSYPIPGGMFLHKTLHWDALLNNPALSEHAENGHGRENISPGKTSPYCSCGDRSNPTP